jgi:16S rRNA (adenine1518-N6/adenine1519-N6)-dimethyltransferase
MSSIRRLRELGLRPKKSFGQNFLQDIHIAEAIANLCTPSPECTVVEIGAGMGALSEPLAQRCARLVAIERDRDLVPVLHDIFRGNDRVEVVEGDAKTLNYADLFGQGARPWVLAGNLPYQISGPLLRLAAGLAPCIDRAVFMLQKELVDRLTAKPHDSDYGALSVFCQAAFVAKRALLVPAGCFAPVPRVDSAVVLLESRRPALALEDEIFRQVVKRAFGKRRKKLSNALKGYVSREQAECAGVDLNQRAEALSVEQFAGLAEVLRSEAKAGAASS